MWDALTPELQLKICKAIQAGDIWLNKVKYDKNGERIFGNVCLEIYLEDVAAACLSTSTWALATLKR